MIRNMIPVLLILLILAGVTLFLLDYLELIDMKGEALELVGRVPYAERFITPQVDAEIAEELRLEVDRVEGELAALKERADEYAYLLERERQRVEEREGLIEELEAELGELRARELEIEEKKDRVAKIYGEMRPARAAGVLARLDTDLAVAILERIDRRTAARLLDSMDPALAAEVTGRMAD